MATDLSGTNELPTTATETIGTAYSVLTIPAGAQRCDIYSTTNAGFFSYEAGAPSIHAPLPADQWFVLWESPSGNSEKDVTVQVKCADAGTVVFYRVV
jgi:hypothetical protein